MFKYSNFQSQIEIQSRNEKASEARKLILEKAKRKYEREERKKEKAEKQGEGTWMLNAVSQRIQNEEKALEKARRDKKKKKKEKKKKKRKKKEKSDSSSSSSNESDEEQWVESNTDTSSKMKGPQLQRESWMEAPLDLIPSISRQDIKDAAQKKKDEARTEAEKMFAPGQHAKELNPYWKDGGIGLPEEKRQSSTATSLSSTSLSGDGGLSWLRKAYQRCKEQAKDEGRNLEDVAAERWGSLRHLKSLIEDAETKVTLASRETCNSKSISGNEERRGHSWRRYENESRKGQEKEIGKDFNRKSYEEMDRRRERKSERDSSRDRDSYRYHEHIRDREKYNDREKRSHRGYDEEVRGRRVTEMSDRTTVSDRRTTFRRPVSDDEENEDKRQSLSSRFKKPNDDDHDEDTSDIRQRKFIQPDEASSSKEREKRLNKPGKSEEVSSTSTSRSTSEVRKTDKSRCREREDTWRKSSDSAARWRKTPIASEEYDKDGMRKERTVSSEKKKNRKKSSSSSSSSSSEEEDDKNMESDKEKPLSEEEGNASLPPKILSEEELNDLAAKILRAEIMGDEALAADLKSKLDNARHVREASKAGTEQSDFAHTRRNMKNKKKTETEGDDDDDIVVLSRTSKGGMVRPVLGSSEEWGRSGGRKRKRKNVATHGEGGERKKFFHDDDNFDLKTLVEREKAGTAEDQNSMFARLAGRAGDRDLDVDDMFVSKAAKNQDEAQASNRDKMAAIFEHRKINAAMEKCHRCFSKVPKHLIVAIGTKSYLCLPPHRSLTDGHCLIVPMSHVSSATSMDEDVWQEIQLFRKSLVQMFTSQDQDIVIMETVMHLKHFPHTAIECVPLDKEVGDLAPIYFKKAIQEEGSEWSDNKKLHDLSKKDVRRVIPKGFPYFSVDFGLQGGFGHVIEDEVKFPNYFGREIVGGMLDAEPSLWRKPHKQSFEDQRQKVLQFEKLWSPFDWTRELNKDD